MIARDGLAIYAADIPTGHDALVMEMTRIRSEIDLREVYFSRLAAAFIQGDYSDVEDMASGHDAIRMHCQMTSNAVSDRVRVGEKLEELPESEHALYNGEIGFAHLSVMARTAEAVGKAFDEKPLLELARKHTPGKFYFKCQHYRHSVKPEEYAQEQAGLVDQRQLSLSQCEDGCYLINGVLDPVAGAAVRSVLEPLARPCGEHDIRNRKQRMADALVEVLTHGGNQRVQMQVTSSVETLLGLIGSAGAENEFTLPISSKTVERWACDCNLTRVLMQDSVVIDVGRAKRVISGPTRRALNSRDGHCTWPGCDRPASWSDGHHLKHWTHGGSSDLSNLTLLCSRHHRMVHEGNWQLVKSDDGQIMPVAPLVTFGSPTRGPD